LVDVVLGGAELGGFGGTEVCCFGCVTDFCCVFDGRTVFCWFFN
jgi:hypothetical protein